MVRKPACKGWRERADGRETRTALMGRPPVQGIAPGRGDSVMGTEGPGNVPGQRRRGWMSGKGCERLRLSLTAQERESPQAGRNAGELFPSHEMMTEFMEIFRFIICNQVSQCRGRRGGRRVPPAGRLRRLLRAEQPPGHQRLLEREWLSRGRGQVQRGGPSSVPAV